MQRRSILVTALTVVALAGVILFAYHSRSSKQPLLCQVCGRVVPKQTEFRIETTHGNLIACCPRCAMHYMLDHSNEVRGARATDYASGRLIDAHSAFYDEGGDVQYCTRLAPAVERGPNDGTRLRTYDRCLPVLVAFAARPEAEQYRDEHGGRVLTYDQALQSVGAH